MISRIKKIILIGSILFNIWTLVSFSSQPISNDSRTMNPFAEKPRILFYAYASEKNEFFCKMLKSAIMNDIVVNVLGFGGSGDMTLKPALRPGNAKNVVKKW